MGGWFKSPHRFSLNKTETKRTKNETEKTASLTWKLKTICDILATNGSGLGCLIRHESQETPSKRTNVLQKCFERHSSFFIILI